MVKKNETKSNEYVKKQTLIGAVVFALVFGFISGTIYSSFKLASEKTVQNKKAVIANNPAGGISSAELGSRILQLEQYLEKNPEDAEAWANLGNQFFDSDQFVNAIEAYKKSLAIEPNKIGVITDLGVMYRRNKQPQKAIEAFDQAISLDPSFETARFNKGVVLLHDLNDVPGGIQAWEEIVEINPMAIAPNGESVDSLVQRMKNQK